MRKALLAILPFVLGAASACASIQAKSSDKPALDLPPPPPHAIDLPAEPLEPVGEIPTASTGTNPGPSRSARPPAPRPQSGETKPEAKPGDAKPDNAPATAPPPEPPAALPATPTPQLRTPQMADASAAAKVRTTIDRAKGTLAGVKFGPLSSERKKAYKDSQLLLQQAEDALKEGNIEFAQAVASKAETLARELAGR